MATSASEDDVGSKPRPPRKALTLKERKAKQAEEEAQALAKLQEPESKEEEFQEIKEINCFTHGNVRQRRRHGMKYLMYAARFSPDSKYLVTCSSDKSVCLWSLETGMEVANYEHADSVRAVAFSPDGLYLCTGCDDKEARVWRVEEKNLITEHEFSFKHRDWVICACYSPDGHMLCTVSRQQEVILHDLHHYLRHGSKRRMSSKLSMASTALRAASKSSAGREPPEGKKLPHDDQLFGACFSSSGELIVTASGWERGHAIIFDVASLEEVLRIPQPDRVMSACLNPTEKMVLTTCKDTFARVWELPKELLYGSKMKEMKAEKEKREQERLEAEKGKKKLVISKKKQRELAEAAEREAIQAELKATEVAKFPHTNLTVCAVWSLDGKRILTGSDTGTVQIIDVGTWMQLIRLEHQEPITFLEFSPSGKRFCLSSKEGTALVYAGVQTLWSSSK